MLVYMTSIKKMCARASNEAGYATDHGHAHKILLGQKFKLMMCLLLKYGVKLYKI